MNKYDELMQRIDHMESLLSSYRASVEAGFIAFGDCCLYSDNTLSYSSNVPLRVPANIYGDISAAMLGLYEYIEGELAETSRKLLLLEK